MPQEKTRWPGSAAFDDSRRGLRRGDVRASLTCIFLTAAAVGFFIGYGDAFPWAKWLVVAAWIGWALVPPTYFLVEWTLYKGGLDDERFKRLQYRQDLASKFWVAGVGVLSVILFQAGLLDVAGARPPAAEPPCRAETAD